MGGLKNVRNRRDDALSRVDWKRLESLLAVYYRGQGYEVEHCGTGGAGRRFDGGVDLKLRKGDEYIVVECKHWNAKQVPHNPVHQLLGVMVNEGATGAILVTSGEFTAYARESASKLGHVQLVDGEALRAMIGPLPEFESEARDIGDGSDRTPMARPRHRDARQPRSSGSAQSGSIARENDNLVWKIAAGVVIGMIALGGLRSCIVSYQQRQALEQFAAEMKRISADPDPLGLRRAASTRTNPSAAPDARSPQRAGAPLDPLRTLGNIASIQGGALLGDEEAVRQGSRRMAGDIRRSMKFADPARRIDREAARAATRQVSGVHSVAWIDSHNLLVYVQRNELRSQSMIDVICSRLEPLGDTLGVIVNLKTRAAAHPNERGTTSRNCQLAPGDTAMLQKVHPTYDPPPEVTAAYRASQRPQSDADRKAQQEAQRIIESSTPEM